jgi:peptidoglycan hydrolase FlgJ
MAIQPISDIVLEVAKAADPVSYRAATERLGSLAGAAAPAEETFADALGGIPAPQMFAGAQAPKTFAPHVPFDPAAALLRMQNRDALAAQPASAYQQFEGFVLQSFIEAMLPKDSPVLFGGGTAGEIWRSMLAEGLGSHLSQVAGIGIAEMLAADASEQHGAEKEGATGHAAKSAAPVCSS